MPRGLIRRPPSGVASLLTVAATLALAGCGGDADPGAATSTSVSAPGPSTTRAGRGDLASVDFVAVVDALDASVIGADDDRRPTSSASLVLLDTDLFDGDGDGEDEAALTVRTTGDGSRPVSNVLIYGWDDGAVRLIADDGWGKPDDHGVRDVSVRPGDNGPDLLVVQRFEVADDECCEIALDQRTMRVSGGRLGEVGEPTRWLVVRRRAPMSPAGPAREPIAVSFLPGSQRFSVTGDVADEMGPVTLDALEGQTLALRVAEPAEGDPEVTVTVSGPDGLLVGEVTSGNVTEPGLSLPTSGTYQLAIRGTEPVGDIPLDERAQFWIDAVLVD